jgi:hypothetical protein
LNISVPCLVACACGAAARLIGHWVHRSLGGRTRGPGTITGASGLLTGFGLALVLDLEAANNAAFVEEGQADRLTARIQVPSCWTFGNRSTVVSFRCTNITCLAGTPQKVVAASTWSETSAGRPQTVMPSSTNCRSDWFEPL